MQYATACPCPRRFERRISSRRAIYSVLTPEFPFFQLDPIVMRRNRLSKKILATIRYALQGYLLPGLFWEGVYYEKSISLGD